MRTVKALGLVGSLEVALLLSASLRLSEMEYGIR